MKLRLTSTSQHFDMDRLIPCDDTEWFQNKTNSLG